MNGQVTDSATKTLENAVLKYITRTFDEADWIDLGIETGTLELIQDHDRLLRALSFGDPDYAQHAVSVGQQILKTISSGHGYNKRLRLEDVTPVFPGFRAWLKQNDLPKYETIFSSPVTTASSEGKPVQPSIHGQRAVGSASSAGSPVRPKVEEPVVGKSGKIGDPDGEIFIVHGHDHDLRNELFIFLQEVTGKKPVILDFQASGGKTLIEKFESKALKASVAVVLLTQDDLGAAKDSSDFRPRARQNVVFEMGYFVGALNRSSVITINDGVEAPSDIAGLVYIPKSGNWYEKLRRELVEAGVKLVA